MADLSLGSGAYNALSLPFAPEAEQSVLGAVLLDSACIPCGGNSPRPEYFYQVNKADLRDHAGYVYPGQGLILLRFWSSLPQKGFDEARQDLLCSWQQLVFRCPCQCDRTPEPIVTARDLRKWAARPASTLLDSAEQRIFDIRRGKICRLQRIDEIILDTFDRLDQLNSPDSDKFRGVPTGIKELDETITGLNRTDLILLGARPGMGKTSFALNIARHAAVKAGRKVAFFSLEMGREQLCSRLLPPRRWAAQAAHRQACGRRVGTPGGGRRHPLKSADLF
ncbi:MAG: DnaB-like helicase C-terminal domain-containing protein [Hydrogeniiclostridium mannosilyticum]